MDYIACQATLSVDFPGKNTVVGCHFLLQAIFPTQGSNPGLLHWQVDSLPLRHLGSSHFYSSYVIYLRAKNGEDREKS